jgi:hypothetical protein
MGLPDGVPNPFSADRTPSTTQRFAGASAFSTPRRRIVGEKGQSGFEFLQYALCFGRRPVLAPWQVLREPPPYANRLLEAEFPDGCFLICRLICRGLPGSNVSRWTDAAPQPCQAFVAGDALHPLHREPKPAERPLPTTRCAGPFLILPPPDLEKTRYCAGGRIVLPAVAM